MLTANALPNLRRRVARARHGLRNTSPAARHVHEIAEALAAGKAYPMLEEDPQHCAASMLAVLESLWKERIKAKARDDARHVHHV